MIGENGVPETPEWQPHPRQLPEFASLIKGLEEAAAGLVVRRDDLLGDDPENIIRGTE